MNDSNKSHLHGIQLQQVVVTELSMKLSRPVEESSEFAIHIATGHSEYDRETREIQVSLSLTMHSESEGEEADPAMTGRVSLFGIFTVDEKDFPVEQLPSWARSNAPALLYPYLREHVYGLSMRCGIRNVFLPLIVVPTFVGERVKCSGE